MNIILSLVCLFSCSFFWRVGGDGHDLARNPGVPIIIATSKFLMTGNPWVLLYVPAIWGMIQAFSYGISAPPHKFWVFVFGKGEDGSYAPVEIATRATCGFFWSLPAAIFAFLSNCDVSWILFSLYVLFLTIVNGIQWKLFKNVEVSERVVGACVSTSIFV